MKSTAASIAANERVQAGMQKSVEMSKAAAEKVRRCAGRFWPRGGLHQTVARKR